MPDSPSPWTAKELSWLSFNERVLQEAADPNVPLIQRVRYMGIFSNNLDEFFRVRVADVRRLATYSTPSRRDEFKELLTKIQDRVRELQTRFDRVYRDNLEALSQRNIHLVNEKQLDENQLEWVRRYFIDTLQPELAPVILDDAFPLPELNDHSIYLAVKAQTGEQVRYGMLEVPTVRLPRFVRIPGRKGKRGYVLIVLENIIRACLPMVFRGVIMVDNAEAYTIKLTRDAELELGEEVTESFFDRVTNSLKRRRKADPVRFVYDSDMPEDLLDYLRRRLGIGALDSAMPGGRYHNSKDFMSFPSPGPAYLDLKPLPTVPVPPLEEDSSIFDAIRERDRLLFYPYNSFGYVIDLLKTAALDPAVKSIKICLYRVASQSKIVDALLNAVANHKRVTAVVELQARFDEEANIALSERLTEGGVNVILGVPGLKVHSKLILITRQESNVQRNYAHIGTGNFNESTARVYTDFSLLTYHQEVADEVAKVFDFIEFTYKRHDFKHLLVSPLNSRSGILALIDREIENARLRRDCGITIKCNNLVDQELIDRLYEASRAGVPIRMIIRGMCSLVPGIPGYSDNIEIISIVDRFLEHPRVYIFHNDGEPEYLLSSADLMTRNIDYRVEVMTRIYDPAARQMIKDIIDIQWSDNMKARIVDKDLTNTFRERKRGAPKIRSQEATHRYFTDGKLPRIRAVSYRPKPVESEGEES